MAKAKSKTKTKRPRQTFSADEKRQYLDAIGEGETLTAAASRFGIGASVLSRWIRDANASGTQEVTSDELPEQNQRAISPASPGPAKAGLDGLELVPNSDGSVLITAAQLDHLGNQMLAAPMVATRGGLAAICVTGMSTEELLSENKRLVEANAKLRKHVIATTNLLSLDD